MRPADPAPMLADMAGSPLPRRELALKLAVAALVLAAVAAVVIWDPIAAVVRNADASVALPDVPDVPKWLIFLLGKAKYILLAVIVLSLVAARRRPPSRASKR
jgi:hypothetical protein